QGGGATRGGAEQAARETARAAGFDVSHRDVFLEQREQLANAPATRGNRPRRKARVLPAYIGTQPPAGPVGQRPPDRPDPRGTGVQPAPSAAAAGVAAVAAAALP